MKQILCFFTPILALLLLLTACGSHSELAPQMIDEDVDICDACTMMVQDNQYSAQIVTDGGEAYKFDDIGCMAMFINDNQPEGLPFVRDFYTKKWIGIDKALFVATEDVETPMNYGFLSFASKTSADKFLAKYSGTVVTWNEVLQNMKERKSDDENKPTHN
ncbi:nitrous oxide reductase accessory protein NosL [Schinkia sp. CFF1]